MSCARFRTGPGGSRNVPATSGSSTCSVDVNISDELDLSVRESKHQIVLSVFNTVVLPRLRQALQTAREQQIRGTVHCTDAFARDVGRRGDMFVDTGHPPGASLVAGLFGARVPAQTVRGRFLEVVLEGDGHSLSGSNRERAQMTT